MKVTVKNAEIGDTGESGFLRREIRDTVVVVGRLFLQQYVQLYQLKIDRKCGANVCQMRECPNLDTVLPYLLL